MFSQHLLLVSLFPTLLKTGSEKIGSVQTTTNRAPHPEPEGEEEENRVIKFEGQALERHRDTGPQCGITKSRLSGLQGKLLWPREGWSEMIQTPQVLSEYHDSPRRVVHVLESSNFTFCGSPVNHKLFEIV